MGIKYGSCAGFLVICGLAASLAFYIVSTMQPWKYRGDDWHACDENTRRKGKIFEKAEVSTRHVVYGKYYIRSGVQKNFEDNSYVLHTPVKADNSLRHAKVPVVFAVVGNAWLSPNTPPQKPTPAMITYVNHGLAYAALGYRSVNIE